MCTDKSPKAFVLSAGIQKLPITLLSVDNFNDRVLCCKPTSINHNIHGCILCRYRATGWFWWISGLRAVAMWSSSSFTKTTLGLPLGDWLQLAWDAHCLAANTHRLDCHRVDRTTGCCPHTPHPGRNRALVSRHLGMLSDLGASVSRTNTRYSDGVGNKFGSVYQVFILI